MQDQLAGAITSALSSATGPTASPAPNARPAGRRFLAAMVAARESGCKCGACVLLRQELDDAIGGYLKAISADLPDGAAAPPSVHPEPVEGPVSDAPGPDHPA